MGTSWGYTLTPEVPPGSIAPALLYAVLFLDF